MKILFVLDKRVNAGSIQAVANYVRAGDEAGHTVALYGRPDPRFGGIRFCSDPSSFDFVVFIAESGLRLSRLQLSRILTSVPRSRRAVVDTDGMYNELAILDGYDRNYQNYRERFEWLRRHEPVADKIFQTTLGSPSLGTLAVPFFGYDPALRLTARNVQKNYQILYVGHNWWRWREMSTLVLPAIGKARDRLGRICFIGSWWDSPPSWADDLKLESAFQVDSNWLRQLRIEVQPPVPYTDVVRTMAEARVNIMLQRPLLRSLRLLTAKYFEVFCAETIPLIALDQDHAESVYGPAVRELLLNDRVAAKLIDVVSNENRYLEIVAEVRNHLTVHHNFRNRLRELVAALTASGDINVKQMQLESKTHERI